MSKLIGKTILHYRILEKLGQGGMGVVYKAEDTKLKRDVALKFLAVNALDTEDEKKRFLREAQAVAALNHSNIAHIYEIDDADGQTFIAMEYIEGKSIRDMLVGAGHVQPLPLDDAIDYTIQITKGLQAAHEKGIVHRDIKSANIMVTDKGQVKIMDFGLAKLADRSMITREGTTLGTVAYMSPEQAQSLNVDHRTDIWSLGVVLYEMISGQLPFKGDYEQAVIYSIQNEEPEPLTALRSGLPIALDGIVAKALAKEPDTRYQHVDELPADLKAIQGKPSGATRISTTKSVETGGLPTVRWQRVLLIVVFAACLGLVVGTAVWNLKPEAPRLLTRFTVTLPSKDWLAAIPRSIVAISPDGRNLVFAADQQLYVRPLDQFQSMPIPGTEGGFGPFFSPDGEWVGFFADGKLKKVSLRERRIITLCDAPLPQGGSWGSDDTIIFAPTQVLGLSRVAAVGGNPEVITTRNDENAESGHGWPEILPGGDVVLFSVQAGVPAEALIMAHSLKNDVRKVVLHGAISARYVSTGHLVYANDGALFAVPFDPVRCEVTGTPERVIEGVLQRIAPDKMSLGHFSVSSTGSLVYLPGSASAAPQRRLVWVTRDGVVTAVTENRHQYQHPRISADGKRLAVQREDDVWLYDISRKVWNRLTFEGASYPIWTPDDNHIVFQSGREGPFNLFWKPTDGGGAVERLTTSERIHSAGSWSPDGQTLLFIEVDPANAREIFMLALSDKSRPQSIISSSADEVAPQLSPNGRWLAYSSDQPGRPEIFVQSFPELDRKWQISSGGGTEPVWARSGQELFYRNSDKMMVAAVESDRDEFSWRTPETLFAGRFDMGAVMKPNYDITPDGQLFVMIETEEGKEPTELHIVLNWFEELKRLVPNEN